jgi:dihydroxyacetone kinase-like protein
MSACATAFNTSPGLASPASGRRSRAARGVEETIPLVARKGRASYLGERSAGHADPGATSSHLLFRALLCEGD